MLTARVVLAWLACAVVFVWVVRRDRRSPDLSDDYAAREAELALQRRLTRPAPPERRRRMRWLAERVKSRGH